MSDTLRNRAESGDADAQFELFNLTSRDDPNAPEALAWLKKAAAQGHGAALGNLGLALLNGRFGLTKNPELALQLFNAGIQKHSALCVWGMGRMLHLGIGMAPDPARALAMFQAAAQTGLVHAQRDLAYLLHEMGSPSDLPHAVRWMESAAAGGDDDASYRLAEWLVDGLGGAERTGEGRERLLALAQAGVARAQAQLGAYLLVGHGGFELAPESGMTWLQRSAEQGDPHGAAKLGIALADTDPERAVWRDANPGDDEAIVAMCMLLNAEDPGLVVVAPTNIRRTLEVLRATPERGSVMALEIDGAAAGYAILIPFWSNEFGGQVCVIDEVYVRLEHRGRGHLTRLMEELAQRRHRLATNAVALGLEVSPDNVAARRSYERLGFRGRNTFMQRVLA